VFERLDLLVVLSLDLLADYFHLLVVDLLLLVLVFILLDLLLHLRYLNRHRRTCGPETV
jgi:hypothetical protein